MARMVFGRWADDRPAERPPTHLRVETRLTACGRFLSGRMDSNRIPKLVTCKHCRREMAKTQEAT